MPSIQKTKFLARRIDRTYVRRLSGLRVWRMAAISVCVVLAVAWWVIVGTGGHQAIYSPGPVSAAHAMWKVDCARCHTGGNSKSVSDTACIGCHDGAIHHQKQKEQDFFISDGRNHAARCADCHSEHRGRTTLASVADNQCVACHRDITTAIRAGFQPEVDPHVTAFTVADHPGFGRSNAPQGRPKLSTKLIFSHQSHLPREGISQDCTVCHSAANPDLRAHDEEQRLPPWRDLNDRSAEWSDDSSRRYFRQITYQRACSGCHRLDLLTDYPGLAVAAHVSLAQLRDQRTALGRPPDAKRLKEWFDAMSPDDKTSRLKKEVIGPPPFRKHSFVTENEDQWLAETVDAAATALADVTGDPQKFVDQLAENRRISSCSKCHPLIDAAADHVAAPDSSTQPATDSATTKPSDLATAPTGIPPYPRRWYIHSTFDHDAHRNMNCQECHKPSAADSSRPDDLELIPTIETCAKCHYTPEQSAAYAGPGAPAGCINCHLFHDRNHEMTREGILSVQILHPQGGATPAPTTGPVSEPTTEPTTQPVATAQIQVP